MVLSLDSDSVGGQCRSVIGSQIDRKHMFVSIVFINIFRLMIGRDVAGLCFLSGPMLAVPDRTQDLSWQSWAALGA